MQNTLPPDLESQLIVDSVHARLFGDEHPTRIGKYIVLRQIGSGAMAQVYLGWHQDLQRNDAIKLVHPAAGDPEAERMRLVREAQALARLAHDNVIRVHDAGTHGERVYIAMEYVQGMTLGTWQKSQPWRAIVDAYVKAGRGLAAAHAAVLDDGDATGARHGLVHRDFKPDNVLVGDDGRVRVADFGLAIPIEPLAHGDSVPDIGATRPLDLRLTASNDVMGTPLYISPEQLASRPADARSDQFSFCVALYEALYRQHPFYVPDSEARASGLPTASQGQGRTAPPHIVLFDAILSGKLRQPPRGPVPRRIFDVLARGLQRDPDRRYPSMNALLADLERDPRCRTLAALGGVAVVGLLAGMAYAQMQPPDACKDIDQEVADLWNDARRADVRAAFVATDVAYAASSFDAVSRELSQYLDDWTHSRQQACDATHVHGTLDRALYGRSMACLDKRRDVVRAAIDELARIDAGTLAGAVDRVRSLPRIADCDDRVLLLQSCTLDPDDPASQRLRDQIRAARANELSGHYREAEPVAAAVARAAATHGVPALAAEASFIHGRILAELGRPAEAREALLAALDVAEGAGCDGLAAELGTWIAKLVALNPTLDAQLGIDWSRYGFAKLKRIPDDHLRRADALGDRGLLHERREHDYNAAEQDYREALALRERDSQRSLVARAVNHLNLGSVLRAQGRHDEALAALRTSLDLHREAYGEGHPNLWKPLFGLGIAATEARRFPEAEQALTQALALAETAFGSDNRKVLEAHKGLIMLELDAGRGELARDRARAVLPLCAQKFPADEPKCLDVRRLLAESLEMLGDPAGALEIGEQVVDIMQSSGSRELNEARLELAGMLVRLERWQPALTHAEAAWTALGGDITDPLARDAALHLGDALLGLARPTDAIAPYEKALAGFDAAIVADPSGSSHTDGRATAAWGLARSLCAAGREPARARSLAREARDSFAAHADDPATADRLTDIDTWTNRPCAPPDHR